MEPHLYEDVARRMQSLIDEGTLRPGERIPSVRRLHRQWSVSISTVLQAYRLLEQRGFIEARPQSGWYVRARLERLPEPRAGRGTVRPRPVQVSSLAYELTSAAEERGDPTKLGPATPDPEFLPVTALGRLAARIARTETRAFALAKPQGNPMLRREIAARMVDAGCTLGQDDLVVTSGAQEALHLCLRAVTRPGDAVAVESPTYFGILEILEALGLHAVEVKTDPREGIDLDHLERILSESRVSACVLMPSHSNPVGASMPDAAKERLARMLVRHDVPLVEDDVSGELTFEGPRPTAVKAFDEEGLVLYCSSVSKTLSPGLRVGWTAPGRWLERVAQLKLAASLASTTLPQLVVAEYLASGGFDRHLRRLRRAFHEQVRRVAWVLGDAFPEGTRVSRPTGGHVLWVELPAGADALRLYHAALDVGIRIAPGVMFSPSRRYQSFLRLNCAVPWSPQVESALRTVGAQVTAQLRS